MFVDSHCHLNDDSMLGDLDDAIQRAFDNGVSYMLVVGWNLSSSKKAIEIANKYEGIYAAIGVHPENIDDNDISCLNEIKELSKNKKVVAIGEIGLDYHWKNDETTKAKQKEWFIKQIDLANELKLPVSIHSRDAIGDTLEILKAHPINRTGSMHCYSGSKESMTELLKLGFYIGFDGPVTYKNAVSVKENAALCPLERILTETDCPYLPPVPYRGQRNEPSYIPLIAKTIAEVKNISIKELEKAVKDNFYKLFLI